MEIEKEVRFEINGDLWNTLLENTTPYDDKQEMLDITCGAYGTESMQKTGRVFRVRKKGNKITLEIKKRNGNDWLEESIKLESVEQGISFFALSGLEPYLYLHRTREVRKHGNLKVFFDDFEMIGRFIEVEYEDTAEATDELNAFLQNYNLTYPEAPLYGTIVFDRCKTDPEFKKKFDNKLASLVKAYK